MYNECHPSHGITAEQGDYVPVKDGAVQKRQTRADQHYVLAYGEVFAEIHQEKGLAQGRVGKQTYKDKIGLRFVFLVKYQKRQKRSLDDAKVDDGYHSKISASFRDKLPSYIPGPIGTKSQEGSGIQWASHQKDRRMQCVEHRNDLYGIF